MNPMLPFVALLTFTASLVAFIPGHIAWVEEATTEQCKTNDWTTAKAAATRAWCIHNGYPVE